MKTFSVLTASKRTGWEEMAFESIARQTIKPFRWNIIYENKSSYLWFSENEKMKLKSVNKSGVWPYLSKAPKQKRLSNLNASLNSGLKLILEDKVDYVIFYQDFIELKEDCFEKLLELATPTTFVTTCTPNYNGSDDGRYTGTDLPRPCRPEEWEANVAIAPMQLLKDCGGFDERLDNGWAWDNALLARKAAMLGAKFICDESNRPRLYPHEMSSHDTLPKNAQLCEQIITNIRNGKEPISCNMV